MEEEKKLGFGAGLGIGLGIGAIILVLGLLIESAFISNSHKALESSVLDNETQIKVKILEKAINDYYYDYKEEPIDEAKMRENMLHGMVKALNDPYSEYLNKDELHAQLEENQGIYYGIGAYISLGEDDFPVFTRIMEGTPAEEAGLHDGDMIYEIDGESAYGLTLNETVSKVKGEEGTQVHITIYREEDEELLEFDVTRALVESPTVSSKVLDDNIGYIRITEFDKVTIGQFQENYNKLRDQNIEALIIDLRANPGGLLNAVLEIGRQILPAGNIVYTENKYGNKNEYTCDGLHEIDIPLAVLVDEYSASASEILAGAVKDYGIGTLVGKTTFGKGIVQDSHLFSDGSAIKLTERAYYTPNGNYIQGIGIEPDIEVELDAEKYYEDNIDTQLEKAKDVLKNKLK